MDNVDDLEQQVADELRSEFDDELPDDELPDMDNAIGQGCPNCGELTYVICDWCNGCNQCCECEE